MIEIGNLTVRLGGVSALSELTVDIDAPIHGVIGPNGAGKTTLLNVISGFVRPASGSIAAEGKNLGPLSPRRRSVWGLRRTFQSECLAPHLSGRDNVAVMADSAVRRSDRDLAVDRALEFAGVVEPEAPAGSMDSFQRRLVEIARALAGDPRIVMLDEPAGGISSEEREELARLIGAIPREYGASVVLVDHDVELIASTCERATVLDFGQLLASGPTSEVLADEHVRRAWIGTAELASTGDAVQ